MVTASLWAALAGGVAWADWQQLQSPRAGASSFLKSNWNKYNENYHPNYVLDGDPKTAWVEGVPGQGEGQQLRIPLSRLRAATRVKLRVRNGYQKSDNLLAANSAPSSLSVSIMDGPEVSASTVAGLERTMGWQDVVVDVPTGKGIDAVVLRVDAVHAGASYKDTCISDVEVWVESTEDYKPAVEAAKAARLKAWIGERVQEAAYFESKPADYPFAAYNFTLEDDTPGSDFEAQAAPLRALESRLEATAGRYRGDGGTALVFPDGVPYEFEEISKLFTPGGLSWFETSGDTGEVDKQDWYTLTTSHFRLIHATPGDRHPEAAWLRRVNVVDERGVTTITTTWVVKFDDRGRPTTLWRRSSDDMDPYIYEAVFTLGRSADGRIDAITTMEQSSSADDGVVGGSRRRYAPQ